MRYDAGGDLEPHVKVPSVLAARDTGLYLYYGNAPAAETNDCDAWDSSFGLVLHFVDSTAQTTPSLCTISKEAFLVHPGTGLPASVRH